MNWGAPCNLASLPRIYLDDCGRPADGATLEERSVT